MVIKKLPEWPRPVAAGAWRRWVVGEAGPESTTAGKPTPRRSDGAGFAAAPSCALGSILSARFPVRLGAAGRRRPSVGRVDELRDLRVGVVVLGDDGEPGADRGRDRVAGQVRVG